MSALTQMLVTESPLQLRMERAISKQAIADSIIDLHAYNFNLIRAAIIGNLEKAYRQLPAPNSLIVVRTGIYEVRWQPEFLGNQLPEYEVWRETVFLGRVGMEEDLIAWARQEYCLSANDQDEIPEPDFQGVSILEVIN